MTIQDDGNVGIGTASPQCTLEVHSATAAPSLDAEGGAVMIGDAASDVGLEIGRHNSSPYGMWLQSKKPSANTAFPMLLNPLGGNVGIGTSSPDSLLHLKSAVDNKPSLYIENVDTDANEGGNLTFLLQDTDTAASPVDNQVIGDIAFKGYNTYSGADEYQLAALIRCRMDGEGGGSASDMPGELAFYTTPNSSETVAQRMCILANGRVGIGSGAPTVGLLTVSHDEDGYAMWVGNDGSNANRKGINLACGLDTASSAADNLFFQFQDGNGSAAGGIRNSTNVDLPEFFEGSDARIKEDIADTKVNALDVLNSLRLREFQKKRQVNKCKMGLVAQEVLEVMPELVGKAPNDGFEDCFDEGVEEMYTVGTGALSYYYIKAIQELSAKVTALENA